MYENIPSPKKHNEYTAVEVEDALKLFVRWCEEIDAKPTVEIYRVTYVPTNGRKPSLNTISIYLGSFNSALKSLGYDKNNKEKLTLQEVNAELVKFFEAHLFEERTHSNYKKWNKRTLGIWGYKKFYDSWIQAADTLNFSIPKNSKTQKMSDQDLLIAIERMCEWCHAEKGVRLTPKTVKEYNENFNDGFNIQLITIRFGIPLGQFLSRFYEYKAGEITQLNLLKKVAPKTKRQNISPKLRAEIFERDKYKCVDCGRSPETDDITLEVNHKLPVSMGGTNAVDNLETNCSDCNRGKSDRIIRSGHENK